MLQEERQRKAKGKAGMECSAALGPEKQQAKGKREARPGKRAFAKQAEQRGLCSLLIF